MAFVPDKTLILYQRAQAEKSAIDVINRSNHLTGLEKQAAIKKITKEYAELNAKLFEERWQRDERIKVNKEILAKNRSNWWRQEKQRRKFDVIDTSQSTFYAAAMDTLTENLFAGKLFIESSIRRNSYGEVFFVALKDRTVYAVSKSDNSDFCYGPLFETAIRMSDNSKIMINPDLYCPSPLFEDFELSSYKCEVIAPSALGHFFSMGDIRSVPISYLPDSPGDWDNSRSWGPEPDPIPTVTKRSKKKRAKPTKEQDKDGCSTTKSNDIPLVKEFDLDLVLKMLKKPDKIVSSIVENKVIDNRVNFCGNGGGSVDKKYIYRTFGGGRFKKGHSGGPGRTPSTSQGTPISKKTGRSRSSDTGYSELQIQSKPEPNVVSDIGTPHSSSNQFRWIGVSKSQRRSQIASDRSRVSNRFAPSTTIPSTISTRVTETQFTEPDFSTQPPTQSSLKTDPDASSLGSKRSRGRKKKTGRKGGPGRGHKKVIPDPSPLDIVSEVASLRIHTQSPEANEAEQQEIVDRAVLRSQRFIDKDILAQQAKQLSATLNDPLIPRPQTLYRPTQRCFYAHKGVYCGAASAKHTPKLYSSLQRDNRGRLVIYSCPECGLLLFVREYKKLPRRQCWSCGNGKVDLQELYDSYNAPFLEDNSPFSRFIWPIIEEDRPNVQFFIDHAYQFNMMFRFGSITMEQHEKHPRPKTRFNVVLSNNALQFNASGLEPPSGREAILAQVYTLRPGDVGFPDIPCGERNQILPIAESSINIQITRRLKQLRHWIPNIEIEDIARAEMIIGKIHEYLAKNNELAQIYYNSKEIFDVARAEAESKNQDLPRMQLMILGQRETESARRRMLAGSDQIHPSRLYTPEGRLERQFNNRFGLMAQIFVSGPACEPPTLDTGANICLRGDKFGEVTRINFGHQSLIPILFTLLTPKAPFGYQRSIPLKKKAKRAQHDPLVQNEPNTSATNNQNSDENQRAETDEEVEQEEGIIDPENLKKYEGHKYVSRNMWTRYMMKIVSTNNSWTSQRHWLWWSERLAQSFVLTMWQISQTEVSLWIKHGQKDLRWALSEDLIQAYKARAQHLHPEERNLHIGNIFHCPATYRQSKAYYQKRYADAMAIINAHGGIIHLFVTFTMDHKCEDFNCLLTPFQTPDGQSFITCRLYYDRLMEFERDLGLIRDGRDSWDTVRHQNVLGPVKAWFTSMEHQMGGQPHNHYILILDWETIKSNWELANPGCGEYAYEDYIEDYITAEIPPLPSQHDQTDAAKEQREYHSIVLDKLYHTCKLKRCKDTPTDHCKKRFPKLYSQCTVIRNNQETIYRRRPPPPSDDEFNPIMHSRPYTRPADKDHKERQYSNAYVVPHNRLLTVKYKAHINVEWAYGTETAKYVCEYAYKGTDMAFVVTKREGRTVVDVDEFHQINLCRFISSQEAMMGLLKIPVCRMSHTVIVIYVCSEKNPGLVYPDQAEPYIAENLIERDEEGEQLVQNQLNEYFTLNRLLSDEERLRYTFSTIPNACKWEKKKWVARQEPLRNGIIRVAFVSPSAKELHATRALAFHVRGPRNWKEYRTVTSEDGKSTTYNTCIEAAIARGLISDDQYIWRNSARAAMVQIKSLKSRIHWLSVMLACNRPHNPLQIVEENLEWLSPKRLPDKMRLKYFLLRLEYVLRRRGYVPTGLNEEGHPRTAAEMIGLPWIPMPPWFNNKRLATAAFFPSDLENDLIAPYQTYEDPEPDFEPQDCEVRTAGMMSMDDFQKFYNDNLKLLTCEQTEFLKFIQQAVIQRVSERVNRRLPHPEQQRLFHITGDGGVGKTHMFNVIISWGKLIRANVIACAPTGLAAQDLFDGTTAHSRFRIPIELDEDSDPNITANSPQYLPEMIYNMDLLIIDEIGPTHTDLITYIDDQCLQSDALRAADFPLSNSTKEEENPFAGKIVIIAGDWKQASPITKHVDCIIPDQRNRLWASSLASIKNSKYFDTSRKHHFVTFRLTINKRLREGQQKFHDYLTWIGAGLGCSPVTYFREHIPIPQELRLTTLDDLIEFVFSTDKLLDPLANMRELRRGAILVPLLKEVQRIYDILLDKLPTREQMYYGIDQAHVDHAYDNLAVHRATGGIENIHREIPPGGPPHELRLKIGAIMLVCRNVAKEMGRVNGTRVQILDFIDENLIKCRWVTGFRSDNNESFLLHRWTFEWGGAERGLVGSGIRKTRVQMPLIPGFVLTFTKSQGQQFEKVGVGIADCPAFAHGQMYVASSRARGWEYIRYLVKHGQTTMINVVGPNMVDQYDIDAARLAKQRFEADNYPCAAPVPVSPSRTQITESATPIEFQTPRIYSTSQLNFGDKDLDYQNNENIPVNDHHEPMEIDSPPFQNNTHERILARLGKSSPYGNCFFGSLSISISGNESGELLIRRAIVNFIQCFVSLGERERNYIDQIWPIQEAYNGNLQYYLQTMIQKARGSGDRERWGHHELGMVFAEIIQRTVAIVLPEIDLAGNVIGRGFETAQIFRPGMHQRLEEYYNPTVPTVEQRTIDAPPFNIDPLRKLPDGTQDYGQIFELFDDAVAIRFNGLNHYEPILKVAFRIFLFSIHERFYQSEIEIDNYANQFDKRDWSKILGTHFLPLRTTQDPSPPVRNPPLTDKTKHVLLKLGRYIRIIHADITRLPFDVDAIVNAANEHLKPGGGVSGAIHKAAGPLLAEECAKHDECPTGFSVVTKAYNIKTAKVIIHSVGPKITKGALPTTLQSEQLRSCYFNSLDLLWLNNYKTIAFPLLSTGIYNYPLAEAVDIALTSINEWLSNNEDAQVQWIYLVVNTRENFSFLKSLPEVEICPSDDQSEVSKNHPILKNISLL